MPEPPKIRLLHDQVLVEPIRKLERFEEKSPSGLLFLPSNPERNRSTEFFWWGRVILTGPGDKYRYRPKLGRHDERAAYQRADGSPFPMDTQPGDIVLYERRPWGDVTLEGREYTIVHEQQHIAGKVSPQGCRIEVLTTAGESLGWSDPAVTLKPGDKWTADLGDGRVVHGVVPEEISCSS